MFYWYGNFSNLFIFGSIVMLDYHLEELEESKNESFIFHLIDCIDKNSEWAVW